MKRILISVFICFFIVLPSIAIYAQSHKTLFSAKTAIILYIEGDVTVKAQGSTRWTDASIDMRLKEGDSRGTTIA